MTPEELERLVQLAPGESLARGAEQALPRDESARGYAAEKLEDIAERLETEGDVEDVLEGQGCIVQHLQWALGTYFAAPANDTQQLAVLTGDYLELGEGELLLGGRDQRVVLRVVDPTEHDKLYVFERGRAEVWAITRSPSPPQALELQVPTLRELTAAVEGEPQLEAEFELLRASADALDRLAAPGLLLRFWMPRTREARNEWLHALVLGDSPLLSAVRGRYASLTPGTQAAMGEIARAELGRLERELMRLAIVEGQHELQQHALRLALDRDRLESARLLLMAIGKAEALARAVQSFDDTASTHLTRLADAALSDERLWRVRASEPQAWWGAIAT